VRWKGMDCIDYLKILTGGGLLGMW
jgi:hypothetical protein